MVKLSVPLKVTRIDLNISLIIDLSWDASDVIGSRVVGSLVVGLTVVIVVGLLVAIVTGAELAGVGIGYTGTELAGVGIGVVTLVGTDWLGWSRIRASKHVL